MIRRPPRSTQSRSSAASDVYKRQLIFNSSVGGDAATLVGSARRPSTSTNVLLTVPDVVWFVHSTVADVRHPVMAVLSSASTRSPAMIHGRFCDCLFVFIL